MVIPHENLAALLCIFVVHSVFKLKMDDSFVFDSASA